MKRIASLAIMTIAAVATSCAVDDETARTESVDTAEDALCSSNAQDNAISHMFANLATAMSIELKRMQFTRDLEIYRGAYNQEMLRVTNSSKSLCGASGCKATNAILAFQSATNKPYILPNGTQLDPWSFASRLVAGWRAQQACEQRARNGDPNACVAEPHYLELVGTQSLSPVCGVGDLSLARFKVSKADLNGRKLSPEQRLSNIGNMQKMYLWTDQDQNLPVSGNPFMQFSVSADGLYQTIDPGEGSYPPSGTSANCPTSLLKFSYTGITNSCCTYNGGRRMWYQPYAVAHDGSGYWRCVNR